MTFRTSPMTPCALVVLALSASLVACAAEDRTAPAAPTAPAGSASPSTTSTSAAPTTAPVDTVRTAEVSVAGGKVTRDSSTFELKRGTKARIVVTSDRADEVHLHTYDVRVSVSPGVPATVEFTATIPGQFEVELEKAGLLLLVVSVR